MKLKVWVVAVLLIGVSLRAALPPIPESESFIPVPAVEPESEPGPAAEKAAPVVRDGYALLNSLLSLFENLVPEKKAAPGEENVSKGGLSLVDERLSQLGVDAKAALDAGLIDKIFFHRIRRLLLHYKLIITPVVRGDLLKDLFEQAFDDFTWNVTYEHWAWGDKDGIAKVAAATEEEFVQLMTYLDTRQERDELKKKIGKRMLPPPPPPPGTKKNPEAK